MCHSPTNGIYRKLKKLYRLHCNHSPQFFDKKFCAQFLRVLREAKCKRMMTTTVTFEANCETKLMENFK